MQTQNPNSLILLMTQANLSEFELECLSDLSHKQAKNIIKHLSGFLTDAQSFAQQIIAQNEAAKAKAEKKETPVIEKESAKPEAEKLDGKKLTPVASGK